MLNSRFIARSIAVTFLTLVFSGGLQRLAGQSFSVSSTPLAPSPVTSGATATSTITVTPLVGFAAVVTLAVTTCPAGAVCTLNPPTVSTSVVPPGAWKSTLTVVPTSSTSVSSTVIVTGTSPGIAAAPTQSTSIALSTGSTSTSASDILKNNFGFGIALGLSTNVTGPNIVTNATIDANGIVRVNTRANTTAGFILETHYFIWPRLKLGADGAIPPVDDRSWGTGPFVAAQPGSAQIIQAVGAGWMIGFRRPKGSTPSGFGLGLGYESIPSAQVLGSEFVPNEPAPLGPNGQPLSIRYETQDKGALLAIFSVTF